MKILLVNPVICLGGGERVIIYLAYHLQQKGHEVYILTTYLDFSNIPEVARSLNYICPEIQIVKRREGRFSVINNPFLWILRLFLLRKKIMRLIREKKIDIINAHNPPSHWISSFLGVPVVWSSNDAISLWKPYREGDFALVTKRRSSLLKEISKSFYEIIDRGIVKSGIKEIIVLDEMNRKRVKEFYSRDSIICHAGVDFTFFSDKTELSLREKYRFKDGFILLQVGNFTYSKNQMCSVRAFNIIQSKIPGAKLILVGDGPLRSDTEREIERLHLRDKVLLPGWVNEEKLKELYNQSHICLFPALRQSWGLTPFEALSAGTISIVSSQCGASEIIQKEGIGLVTEPKAEAFADKILYVYKNPDIVQKIIEKGKNYIKNNLTYQKYTEKVEKILMNNLRYSKISLKQ
jgi:glycosyltransferase involved in cell wall biosynthesis